MLREKVFEYTVVFEPSEEGGYTAVVPALPGWVSEGETLKEARAMVQDAMQGYLASLKKHGEEIPTEFKKPIIERVTVPHKIMA